MEGVVVTSVSGHVPLREARIKSSPEISQSWYFFKLSNQSVPNPLLSNCAEMPGEIVDEPNPPPLPSHLPADVDALLVTLEKKSLNPDIKQALEKWQRAANYLAASTLAYAFAHHADS
jgi:hypothetical protein